MKLLLSTFCYALLCFTAKSQPSQVPDAIFFKNSATQFLNSNQSDSTVYYIKKLADSSMYGGRDLFTDFIHNTFAQSFGYHNLKTRTDREVMSLKEQIASMKKVLLILRKDTSQKIQKAINPIWFVVQVQDSIHNNKALARLMTAFINQELTGDIYQNRQARYGLYVSNLLSGNIELKTTVEILQTTIKDKLLANEPPIRANRLELEKRAWYRYLYAYTCNKEANETADIGKKKALLQKAFLYSPDAMDMSNKGDFFYDMVFLLDEEKYSFRQEYLRFLQNNGGSKDEILAALSSMAILDTGYKQKLKTFYSRNYNTEKPFDEYWLQLVSKEAKEKAPAIRLTLLNKSAFSSEAEMGKWILVDFWGTWCGPCRAEHPDLEKFYRSSVLPNPGKISLLTIACRDRDEQVIDYMKEKRFSFPVAMSDGTIENLYKVQGYPTKLLITPAGNYIVIPFGFDWTNYVKEMVNL